MFCLKRQKPKGQIVQYYISMKQREFKVPIKSLIQNESQPTSWRDFILKPQLLKAIQEMQYMRPSQVQIRALPPVLNGKDVIYQAKSGMGKTSVFIIGILNNLQLSENRAYVPHQCIVIAHTRQLAYQILQQFRKHAKYFTEPQVRCASFFGGLPIQKDIEILSDKKKTPHIIIGTIGRLLDLLQRGFINLKLCKFLVVDECDFMLKKKDEVYNQITFLVRQLGKNVQKVMLSATISESILSYCKEIMSNPEPIVIRVDEEKLSTTGLTQFYKILPEKKKVEVLQHLLDMLPFDQAIIFVEKIQRVNKLADLLDDLLFNPIRIHSGLSQKERLECYDQFKNNGSRVLVATNLFGRGIDIQRVNLVINFDFPSDKQTYLHRVGRASRFGGKGVVINFIKAESQENGQSEEKIMRAFQWVLASKMWKLPNDYDVLQHL